MIGSGENDLLVTRYGFHTAIIRELRAFLYQENHASRLR